MKYEQKKNPTKLQPLLQKELVYNKRKQAERPKDTSNKLEYAKKKYPCNKCKELGHWAAECPQNKSSELLGTSVNKNKNNTNVFLAYSFGSATDGCIKPDQWYCDSGTSKHITPNKLYFESYKICCFRINLSGKTECHNESIWTKNCQGSNVT